jgi:hypothetical protein
MIRGVEELGKKELPKCGGVVFMLVAEFQESGLLKSVIDWVG